MNPPRRSRRHLPLGLALLMASCGSSRIADDSGQGLLDPSQVLDPSPLITIAASGVSPQVSHMFPGVPVRFVNNDRVAHRLTAAPELGYGDCPELAGLGTLAAGQSGTMTVNRQQAICAYHDDAGPSNRAFQGLLVAH